MLAISRLQRRIFRCSGHAGVAGWNRCSSVRGLNYEDNCIFITQSSQVYAKKVHGLFRHYLCTNHVTSFPVGVFWIWPFFAIFRESCASYQSVATQASPNEEELTDEMLNQVLSASENDPISSRDICNTYIVKLCRAGNLSAATRFLQSLHRKNIFLSPMAYGVLLEAVGGRDDIELLSQVFKDLLVSCESLSSVFYLNLAKAFSKIDDCVLLLRFVRDVSELTFPISATVVNRIIFAFSECGQSAKALLIFDHMKSLKCKPDLVTYNTVLDILGCSGRVDEMLHEFASMKEANIIPDIITYNTLLNCLWKVGRLNLCLLLFREMHICGVEPDLRSYTALIEAYGRAGNVEESLKVFDEMKQRRVRPSIRTYKSLINNLVKIGKLKLARKYMEEMNACLSDFGRKDFNQKKR